MFKKYIDLKLFKYIVLFYTVVALLGGIRFSYFKLNGYFEDESWLSIWFINIFTDWLIVLLIMLFVSHITKKMMENKTRNFIIILVHLFLSLLMNYIIFILGAFINYLFFGDIYRVARNTTFNHFMNVVDLNFMVYACMLGIIYSYYYIKKINTSENQKIEIQNQLTSVKMNVLKAQLHPHFVFNTLNSISSLIEEDKETAKELITDFGDLFKEVVAYKDDNLIPFEKELSFLNKYLEIIFVRFSDHLVINKKIANNLEHILVPNMLLQPLLENAVKYGYSYDKTELIINLNIKRENDYLFIEIENNGALLQYSFKYLLKKGTGLSNTQERLKTLYKNDFDFIVKNKNDNSGVVTKIKIPIIY